MAWWTIFGHRFSLGQLFHYLLTHWLGEYAARSDRLFAYKLCTSQICRRLLLVVVLRAGGRWSWRNTCFEGRFLDVGLRGHNCLVVRRTVARLCRINLMESVLFTLVLGLRCRMNIQRGSSLYLCGWVHRWRFSLQFRRQSHFSLRSYTLDFTQRSGRF